MAAVARERRRCPAAGLALIHNHLFADDHQLRRRAAGVVARELKDRGPRIPDHWLRLVRRLCTWWQPGRLPERKLGDVPRWRESDAFTEVERLVLEYAESMTVTPPAVTDDLVADLRRHFDDGQLVELTMMIAVENQRSRFNSALGLTSQGFTDRCELKLDGFSASPARA